jgi:hypothetical protein
VDDYETRIDPRTRQQAAAAAEEAVDYDYQATSSTELTARGLTLFQFDTGLYRSNLKCYKEITTGLGKVVTWITNHLATGQNEYFFVNEETIREGLKKMLGLSSSYLKTKANNVRNKMLDHYAKIPTNTKKMKEWVNDWGIFMQEGITLQVMICTDPSTWIGELLKTGRPVEAIRNWAENFDINKQGDVMAGNISFPEVQSSLLTHIQTGNSIWPKSKIKASFPTLHGKEAAKHQAESYTDKEHGHSANTGAKGRGKKRMAQKHVA